MTKQQDVGEIVLYTSSDGKAKLQVRFVDETVWLSQKQISELYQVTVQTIQEHLANIYSEKELSEVRTIRKFLIVRKEGNREVKRNIDHYNLEAILAVGYRVRAVRGTQFRQWVTSHLQEFLTKGFVLDDERLKSGQNLGKDYFDELILRIRDIRASERRFYQKITDIYATSVDYDSRSEVTEKFYATVQNKLHWAIHGQTAAELIYHRADSQKKNMGLTTWKNSPDGPIRKSDIGVAKNYLGQEELEALNRIVVMYLDYAENQALRRKPMYMNDWAEKLDAFLEFNEQNILRHAGKISHQLALEHAESEYKQYHHKKLENNSSDFDEMIKKLSRKK